MAALKGSTSEDFVRDVWPRMQLTVTDDYDEAINLVREGKVGAMVADFPICALSVLRFPDDGFATLTEPLTIEPMGVAMPPNDPLFLNMMENYLGALEGIGILELLEEKWFQDGSWLDPDAVGSLPVTRYPAALGAAGFFSEPTARSLRIA